MLRIDFYVQHLVRHNASAIELVSGEPARFRFPEGERRSNTPIEHAQLIQVVQEVAPMTAMQELRETRQTAFIHRSAAGLEIKVDVREGDSQKWRVMLSPASSRDREPTAIARPKSTSSESGPPAPRPMSLNVPETRPQASIQPDPAEVRLEPGEPQIHRFLRKMIVQGASDLHLSSEVVPLVRLHGEMKPLENSQPLRDSELRSLLMEIAPERNRAEFQERNDTDFAHMIPEVARFRANYFMDRNGIGAVFRQIPFEILPPEKLGLPKQVLDLCWLSKGLVLVTGPTGSGKSTTLATLIDFINSNRSDHIITIEDPIEFVHGNKKCLVNQREVGTHTESFKSALRAALREDPDIVLVGEMRDLETIAIAIETAETGHLVFGTLHTTTAPSTVDRIIDQFPADRQEQIRTMLATSLKGVIAQVLCKKKAGGRAAAYEVLIANSAVSSLIREGKTYQLVSVMQTGKNLGMQTMNEHFLQLVKSGQVDANEAYIKAVDKVGLKDLFAKNNINVTV